MASFNQEEARTKPQTRPRYITGRRAKRRKRRSNPTAVAMRTSSILNGPTAPAPPSCRGSSLPRRPLRRCRRSSPVCRAVANRGFLGDERHFGLRACRVPWSCVAAATGEHPDWARGLQQRGTTVDQARRTLHMKQNRGANTW